MARAADRAQARIQRRKRERRRPAPTEDHRQLEAGGELSADQVVGLVAAHHRIQVKEPPERLEVRSEKRPGGFYATRFFKRGRWPQRTTFPPDMLGWGLNGCIATLIQVQFPNGGATYQVIGYDKGELVAVLIGRGRPAKGFDE